MLGLLSEDFQREFRAGYNEGLQSSSGQSYPNQPQQQCPPGTAPAIGPGAQPGICAPIPGSGAGYSTDDRGGQYQPNTGSDPYRAPGQFGSNTQYNRDNRGGQYDPNSQYGPNGELNSGQRQTTSGGVDLGAATEQDGW